MPFPCGVTGWEARRHQRAHQRLIHLRRRRELAREEEGRRAARLDREPGQVVRMERLAVPSLGAAGLHVREDVVGAAPVCLHQRRPIPLVGDAQQLPVVFPGERGLVRGLAAQDRQRVISVQAHPARSVAVRGGGDVGGSAPRARRAEGPLPRPRACQLLGRRMVGVGEAGASVSREVTHRIGTAPERCVGLREEEEPVGRWVDVGRIPHQVHTRLHHAVAKACNVHFGSWDHSVRERALPSQRAIAGRSRLEVGVCVHMHPCRAIWARAEEGIPSAAKWVAISPEREQEGDRGSW
eukprot:scaffold78317_cov55-Phaeocystis_antarctica.AAC.2